MIRKDRKVLDIVIAALFAALICVATMVFTIPLPGKGYLNTGDCFVILAGCLMGPAYGAAAGAVGSALADILLGYAVYAPGTFVVKGAMALAAYLVYRAVGRETRQRGALPVFLAGIAAEIVMIGGYFLYELVLFGFYNAVAAVAGNCLQGAGGVVISTVILAVLLKNRYVRGFFPKANISHVTK
ncbi:MAG: ECF transporter S component [Oscillospiraceae bacterium]|nr:ECF transporter S component [Oscillospiraceae bacterium]